MLNINLGANQMAKVKVCELNSTCLIALDEKELSKIRGGSVIRSYLRITTFAKNRITRSFNTQLSLNDSEILQLSLSDSDGNYASAYHSVYSSAE
jgi:hypothetical protein